VLCIGLLVVMCFAYLNLRTQQPKVDEDQAPLIKKGAEYDVESRILFQMAREKEIQIQATSRRKVSVHLEGGCGHIKTFEVLIRRLLEVVDPQAFAGEVESISTDPRPVKVFKYNTQAGAIALIRQLSASTHIETSVIHFNVLRKLLPRIVSLDSVVG